MLNVLQRMSKFYIESMPKSRFLSALLVLFLLLILPLDLAMAQVQEHELPRMKNQAMEAFTEGDFESAQAYFNQLSQRYPKDPDYRYYNGICLVKMKRDLAKAIELLYFASSRGVPADVNYYLGEAYRLNYDFDNAEKQYRIFEDKATRSDAREKDVKSLIASAENADKLTSSYNPFEVEKVSFVNFGDPAQYQQIKMKGGVLGPKPSALFREGEEKEGLNTLMFIVKDIQKGDQVYYSGPGKNRKEGFQLMQAKKSIGEKWTDIKEIDALNSEGNEILPYWDPIGKDLYFASDGRQGLGGFDLYRPHFDEEKKTWSEPISLGFPINSVYDDYLLLPGTDLGKVMFFSGRQTRGDAVALYSVHLSEPKLSIATATPEEKARIARLGGAAQDIRQNEETIFSDDLMEIATNDSLSADTMSLKKPETNSVQSAGKSTSQGIITEALNHQALADSLSDLAQSARLKARKIDDPDKRWQLQRNIMMWEKQSSREQEKADMLFAKVMPETEKNIPEIITLDTIINGIKVFNYVVKQDSGGKMAKNAPYNDNNPIPVDISIPGGAFYRIQLGAYSQPVEYGTFKGITPLSAERIIDRNLIKYYAGRFTDLQSASSALKQLRSQGYSDAFIVAWYNGTRMSPEKVNKLEKNK